MQLTNNNFKDICVDQDLSMNSFVIDLSGNKAQTIKRNCFHGFKTIRILVISNNFVVIIENLAFAYLESIECIDLRNNRIAFLKKNVFQNLNFATLRIINIKINPIAFLDSGTFRNLQLNTLLTNSYQVCCLLTKKCESTGCTQKIEWPSSCSDIISYESLRISTWIFAVLIITFNIGPIIFLKAKIQHFSGYHLFSVFIHSSDLMCGFFLLIIITADDFRETYVENEIVWRTSILCLISSFLNLIFNILSLFCMPLCMLS